MRLGDEHPGCPYASRHAPMSCRGDSFPGLPSTLQFPLPLKSLSSTRLNQCGMNQLAHPPSHDVPRVVFPTVMPADGRTAGPAGGHQRRVRSPTETANGPSAPASRPSASTVGLMRTGSPSSVAAAFGLALQEWLLRTCGLRTRDSAMKCFKRSEASTIFLCTPLFPYVR